MKAPSITVYSSVRMQVNLTARKLDVISSTFELALQAFTVVTLDFDDPCLY